MLPLLLALVVTQTIPPRRIAEGVIIGRAACQSRTWLLTDARVLTSLSTSGDLVSSVPVAGLRADDRPWGLACLGDGSLWTLARPRALARLGDDGHVMERIDLPLPRVSLYGAGDRLLFQSLPIVAGQNALQTAAPRLPAVPRPWRGLTNRGGASAEHQIARNLVVCGMGDGRQTPCWFVGASRMSVADDVRERTVALESEIARAAADPEAPLHDAAVVGDATWVVFGGRQLPALRLAGARILHRSRADTSWSAIDLSPPARLIVSASPTSCVLLRTDGSVVEVRHR